MAAPTYNDIVTFTKAVKRVSSEAKNAFLSEVGNVDFSDWTKAAQQIRDIVERITLAYGAPASELGAQWYEYCRKFKFSMPYTALLEDVDTRTAIADVNNDIDKLFDGVITEATLVKAASHVVESHVYNASRDTISSNLTREYNSARKSGNRKFAEKVGYARVPQPGACAFCVMLASQGFHYSSEQTAGDGYHNHCECVVVPFSEAKEIDGYESMFDEYEEMYSEADDMRRSGEMPEELKERIQAAKEQHTERYKAGETSEKWKATNETLIVMRHLNGLS